MPIPYSTNTIQSLPYWTHSTSQPSAGVFTEISPHNSFLELPDHRNSTSPCLPDTLRTTYQSKYVCS
ncbi:hypothetical protein BDQ94DRAFT_146047 [Aspergillus welwitschiae]|uniref:Uncharacterized protein n=1 Tax=Aspergillus welwitschiae TaxID=1341132 RepID=A0A3F3PYD8_9EURO|nr:hypothetical protein BDQ94DRAFT_146047 [Aspergillus welwitschiae]RDH31933.1 hypothetical protein BDQ94DRAFT_146047 [Aspergillus welwitschiae]